MSSSHLLRAPCDKWVYDFPYDFKASYVATAYEFTLCMNIVPFWRRAGQSCTEAVRTSYGNRAVPVQSPQISHGNRKVLERAP